MAFFNFPFHVTKDKPAMAVEVQTNFDELLAWVLANLVQKDGTVSMTGPLVLAPGVPAAPNQAANKAYVDAAIPVGTIHEYAGTALPTNWLWCNGDTHSESAQRPLFNAIGRSFTAAAIPTGSFQVPDKRQRFSVGRDPADATFALGNKGGQRNSEIISHQHIVPEHGHGASGWSDNRLGAHNHGWSGTTSQNGNHGHNWGHGTQFWWVDPNGWQLPAGQPGPGLGGSPMAAAQWLHDGAHQHTIGGTTDNRDLTHAHAIGVSVANQAAFWTQATGAGTTLADKNLPPYLVVNYIIYAGIPV